MVWDLNCHHKRLSKIRSWDQAVNLSSCAGRAYTRGSKNEGCFVSKYSLAKELLESGYEKGKELSLDEADVAEVMVVQSIQELIRVKGGK